MGYCILLKTLLNVLLVRFILLVAQIKTMELVPRNYENRVVIPGWVRGSVGASTVAIAKAAYDAAVVAYGSGSKSSPIVVSPGERYPKRKRLNRLREQIRDVEMKEVDDVPSNTPAPTPRPTRHNPKRQLFKSLVNRGAMAYKGKFKRPRRGAVTRQVKYHCVCKDERAFSQTGSKCVYVLHCTHPPKYVLRMIFMSIVERYYRQNDIKITNWLDNCPMKYPNTTVANSVGVKVFLFYQSRVGNATNTRGQLNYMTLYDSTGTGVSYLALADTMATNFAAAINTFDNDLFFTDLQFVPDARTNEAQFSHKKWDTTEMFISVKGVSHLQVQNRTEGGDGTSAENALVTSIYANPLEGKHYSFKGTGVRIKDFGNVIDGVGPNLQLVCDATGGTFHIDSGTTSLSSQATDVLKQPASPKYFSRCTGASNVRMAPGAIMKSYAKDVVTKSFLGWVKSLFSYVTSGSTLNGTEAPLDSATGALSKYSHLRPGVGRMLGLEKVADLGNSDVNVAWERDAVYSSRLFFKRKRFIPATNNQMPTTLPAPNPA